MRTRPVTEDVIALCLEWREVETPCPRCKGSGVRGYGNSATWRGGMGAACISYDVCDHCWGSGDAHRHWTDLRKLRDEEAQRVAHAASELLSQSVGGVDMTVTRAAVTAIADELNRLARGRKDRPRFFYDLCTSLEKTLRKMSAP